MAIGSVNNDNPARAREQAAEIENRAAARRAAEESRAEREEEPPPPRKTNRDDGKGRNVDVEA